MATMEEPKGPMGDFEAGKWSTNHAEASSVDTNEKRELQKQQTLSYIDVENKLAFKGDDSDGKVEWTFMHILATFFLCMLYTGRQRSRVPSRCSYIDLVTGSQIILYFVGGSLTFITASLKAPSTAVWLPVSNTLAIAAVVPYTGYLQDLFGKRYIALFGATLICVGIIVLGTAHTFGAGVTGMALSGAGAGIGELTGLAGISEIVPVKHRGYSLAILTAFVVVFTPYIFYCQLLGTRATWRWVAWISLIYNGVTGIGLALTYFPHNHTRAEGFSRKNVLRKIDYLGGFLSIVGITLLLVALQAGGYTHPWKGAYVLCCLIIGFFLLVAWFFWEWKGTKYPMVPFELFKGQRIVALGYCAAFVAGMNFYSVLNFLPLMWDSQYVNDPIQIGLKGFPPAMSTTIGAIGFNALLSTFPDHNREVLFTAATIMTVFGGSLAATTPDNPKTAVALASIATFGVGGMIVPTATVALLASPDMLITTCAALSLSVRTIGGAIGYSIYVSRPTIDQAAPANNFPSTTSSSRN